jgi:hypothetical protein
MSRWIDYFLEECCEEEVKIGFYFKELALLFVFEDCCVFFLSEPELLLFALF